MIKIEIISLCFVCLKSNKFIVTTLIFNFCSLNHDNFFNYIYNREILFSQLLKFILFSQKQKNGDLNQL
jgi:hypothetical protein